MEGCWYTACRERSELDRRVGLSPKKWWGWWRWWLEEVEDVERADEERGPPLPRDGGKVDVVAEGTVLRDVKDLLA